MRKAKRKTTTAKRKSRVTFKRAKAVTRRRYRSLRAGALSKGSLKTGVMDAVQGALGAVIASFVLNQKFLDSQSNTNKGLLIGAASVLTGAYMKRPALAAGMAAVAGLKLAQGLGAGTLVGLSDDGSYMPPIAEGITPGEIPYGLMEGADYAGLSEDVYASDYANVY